jgi:hypothetical protein
MSPDILLKIRKHLINSVEINEIKLNQFLGLLSRYKRGHIIHPGVFIRRLNITMKQVYKLLDEVKSLEIIEQNFEVYCYKCNKYTGDLYKTISQIPDDLICENCEEELNPLENTIVVYSVLVDDE